jgi:sec-independent protein translocase protein TatA
MLAFLEGPDLIIVAVIVLVIFGGSKIPQLARSLGEAQREFKKGLSSDGTAKATATESTGGSAPAAADTPAGSAEKTDTAADHEVDRPS